MTAIPDDLLGKLPDTVAARIKIWLPHLETCKGMAGRFDLDALTREGIKAPAVLVSRLGARQGQDNAGPHRIYNLNMAAFVVTKDRLGLQRDDAAAAICQALLARIPGRSWGLADLGAAEQVQEQSLITATSQTKGASLWVVQWTQPAALTPVPDSAPVPIEVYIGQYPEVGAAHAEDYDQVGGPS